MTEEQSGVVRPFAYKGYHNVLSASMLMLMGTMGIWSMTRLQPQLMSEMGWTAADVSGAVAINIILASIMAPFAGYLIDRISPRWTAFIGAIIAGSAIALQSVCREVWHLYLTYGVMLSVGLAISHIMPGTITIRRWFMRRAASMTSVVFTASSIGIFLIPLIANFSLEKIGLFKTYLFLGISVGLGMAIFALLLERDPGNAGQVVDNMPFDPEFIKTREEFMAFSEKWTIREAIRTSQFWILATVKIFTYFGVMGMSHHFITWANMEVRLDMKTAVWLYAFLYALISLVGKVVGGFVSDRMMVKWGRKPVLCFSYLGMISAYLLVLFMGKGLVAAAIFAALLGFSFGAILSPLVMLIGDTFGTANIAHLQGFYGLVQGPGVALSPLVFGIIFTKTGSYTGAFVMAVCSLAIALIGTTMLSVPKKSKT